MSKVVLVAQRELRAYARSPLGASVVAGALLVDGILFYWKGLTQKLLSAEVLSQFFYNTSGVTLAAALILAMRLIAEEHQTHTFTLLSTSPIRDWEIVLGKFLSAFAVLSFLTLLTLYMPLLIFVNGKVSGGHILVGYLGLLLLGAAAIAVGLFASAIARSQVVAIILGAAFLAPLLMLWMIAQAVDPPLNRFISAVSLHHENFRPFMNGILELQGVAYYLVMIYFFLLAATKILEARRWR